MNITIENIKEIEERQHRALTEEERSVILKRYQKVVMDKAEDWDEIVSKLIEELHDQEVKQ
jgi:hypothetical protein